MTQRVMWEKQAQQEVLSFADMNKKQINIVLGLASLAIYGSIAYKVLPAFLEDDQQEITHAPAALKSIDDFAEQRDTVTLRLNYPDPFGITAPAPKRDTFRRTIAAVKTAVTVPLATIQDMSFIKYAGFINNPQSGKRLVILLINGKSAMLKEGETAEGVKLIKVTNDGLKISYRSHVSYLAKSL